MHFSNLGMVSRRPSLERSGYPQCKKMGVCAIPCPSSAIRLVRKSDAIPLKDFKELHREILKERKPAA
jgi:hypothetical protein